MDAVQPLVDFAHEVAMPGTRFECGWSVSCVRDRVGECDFDAVHVGFAVTREALDELLPLAAENGVVVAPIVQEEGTQRLVAISKSSINGTPIDAGATMCQPDIGGPYVAPKTREERLNEATEGLAAWKRQFEKERGKKPTRQDIDEDAHAKELFASFASLRRYGDS